MTPECRWHAEDRPSEWALLSNIRTRNAHPYGDAVKIPKGNHFQPRFLSASPQKPSNGGRGERSKTEIILER